MPQDITIEGPGIEAEHCLIENRGGVITLDPCGHLCSLDGVPVIKPTQLTQGSPTADTAAIVLLFMTCIERLVNLIESHHGAVFRGSVELEVRPGINFTAAPCWVKCAVQLCAT